LRGSGLRAVAVLPALASPWLDASKGGSKVCLCVVTYNHSIDNRRTRLKIVGVGLNKTGTKSLGVCLRYWGCRHISCSVEAFELYRSGEYAALMDWVAKYDSFDDWPWPLIYREIDAEFPGTKFILTKRKSPEVWFDSLCKHADRTGPTRFRSEIYGYDMPHRYRDEHIRFYEQYVISVREYFRQRPDDLIEVCWETGDGWRELAGFLGFEEPAMVFPHVNRSPGLYVQEQVEK